jgi:hypothetical protein
VNLVVYANRVAFRFHPTQLFVSLNQATVQQGTGLTLTLLHYNRSTAAVIIQDLVQVQVVLAHPISTWLLPEQLFESDVESIPPLYARICWCRLK